MKNTAALSMVYDEISMELCTLAVYAQIGADYARLADQAGLNYSIMKMKALLEAATDNLIASEKIGLGAGIHGVIAK